MKLSAACLLDSRQQARNELIFRDVVALGGSIAARLDAVDIHGKPGLAIRVTLPDNVACVALLNRLFPFDAAHDPWILDMGRVFREPAERMTHGERCLVMARQVHAFVQTHFRYDTESVETFRAPWITAELGGGDCDDHALVVAALCHKLSVPVAIVGVYNAQDELCHVCAVVPQPYGMDHVWMETTIPANFGEHPFSAAKRLRSARKDLTE